MNFTKRLGIQARGKHHLLIENCRLVGSIGHHLKLMDCSKPKIIGCHIAGGHWSVYLIGITDPVFRRCLIEKCQGDAIKTGGGSSGVVRGALVEDCVFQDNLRDGIDTTGGFNDSVVRNSIFRRLGVRAWTSSPTTSRRQDGSRTFRRKTSAFSSRSACSTICRMPSY